MGWFLMVSRKGTLLEKEVLRLFKLVGFEPEHSKKIEGYEVDVFLEYKGFKIIVECKQYEKSSLSVRNLIHQWESKNKILKADRVLLVLVGSEITHKERSLAENYGIKIWNEEKLDTFLDKAIEHKDKIRAEILEDLGIRSEEVKAREEEREKERKKELKRSDREYEERRLESQKLAIEKEKIRKETKKEREEEKEKKRKIEEAEELLEEHGIKRYTNGSLAGIEGFTYQLEVPSELANRLPINKKKFLHHIEDILILTAKNSYSGVHASILMSEKRYELFLNVALKNPKIIDDEIENFVEKIAIVFEKEKIAEREKKYALKEKAEREYYGAIKTKRQTLDFDTKETIFSKFNYKCAICNATQGLHIHHKDENPSNNQIDNLLVLCSVCHKKVHMKVR